MNLERGQNGMVPLVLFVDWYFSIMKAGKIWCKMISWLGKLCKFLCHSSSEITWRCMCSVEVRRKSNPDRASNCAWGAGDQLSGGLRNWTFGALCDLISPLGLLQLWQKQEEKLCCLAPSLNPSSAPRACFSCDANTLRLFVFCTRL